jgi:hypothetical protein
MEWIRGDSGYRLATCSNRRIDYDYLQVNEMLEPRRGNRNLESHRRSSESGMVAITMCSRW